MRTNDEADTPSLETIAKVRAALGRPADPGADAQVRALAEAETKRDER